MLSTLIKNLYAVIGSPLVTGPPGWSARSALTTLNVIMLLAAGAAGVAARSAVATALAGAVDAGSQVRARAASNSQRQDALKDFGSFCIANPPS